MRTAGQGSSLGQERPLCNAYTAWPVLSPKYPNAQQPDGLGIANGIAAGALWGVVFLAPPCCSRSMRCSCRLVVIWSTA